MEITVRPAGNKKLEVDVGDLVVRTDLPKDKGGENSAPSPYRMFLSSIAACAGIFALNFCQQRDLSTDGLKIVQRQSYDESGNELRKVELEVTLPVGFPEKYRKALLRAVELCPVKRAFAAPPEFRITATPA